MNKEFFGKQINRLVIEFSDKGFKMTKERASQWFDFMKDISEETFAKCINAYLETQKNVPTMADILNMKEKVYSPYKED